MINKILSKVIDFANIFIALIFLITLFFGLAIYFRLYIDPDANRLYPSSNRRIRNLKEKFDIEDIASQYVYLTIESDELFTLENLRKINNVIQRVESFPEITGSITPLNFVSFSKKGAHLDINPIAPGGVPPKNEEELELYKIKLLEDRLAETMVYANNGKVFNLIFLTGLVEDPEKFTNEIKKEAEALNSIGKVRISGESLFSARTSYYLKKDLKLLLVLAALVILFILFISFRSKRAIFFPLITILCGTVWSMGFMAMLKFPITVVSILLPALVLSIGSSYTVHVLNEYYRSYSAGKYKNRKIWIIEAVSHVNKTIFMAASTTIIGFVSLLVTTMPLVREFSISIIFGIFSCAILSLFLLPALLYKLNLPKNKQIQQVQSGWLTAFSRKVGSLSYRFRFIIMLILPVIAVLAVTSYPHISQDADYIKYYPSSDPIIADTEFIVETFGGAQNINVTLRAPEGEKNYFLKVENLQKVDSFINSVENFDNVQSILSYIHILKNINYSLYGKYEVPKNKGMIIFFSKIFRVMTGQELLTSPGGGALLSEDYNTLTLYCRVYDSEKKRFLTDKGTAALEKKINDTLTNFEKEGLESALWGSSILFKEAAQVMNREQILSTAIALLLVLIYTAFIFKSLRFGLVSLIPLIVGVLFYYIAMALFGITKDIATVLVTNIAIGVGIDDAIHYLLRFKDRKLALGNVEQAVIETNIITGRPIILTTLSITAGLLILCFSSFKPIMYFGILVSVSLFTAMVGTLILMPAFLGILFRKKNI